MVWESTCKIKQIMQTFIIFKNATVIMTKLSFEFKLPRLIKRLINMPYIILWIFNGVKRLLKNIKEYKVYITI